VEDEGVTESGVRHGVSPTLVVWIAVVTSVAFVALVLALLLSPAFRAAIF
jgi:hypothetical protein